MSCDQTLIFSQGNLITLDPARPRASVLGVRDGEIVYVGDDAAATPLAALPAQHIDLAGKTVVPGFIDAHIHLYSYGAQLLCEVDLVGCKTIDEILQRLSQLASRTQGWIQGWGFDQEKLREQRFPTRDELDRISRDRPIIVSRVCGHAAVVNSAAIALISDEERRAGDERSGLYTENSIIAFYRDIPPLSDEQAEEAVLVAARVALGSGITSVQTLLDTPDQMAAYARLRRKGKLPIRVVGMPPYDSIGALHEHGINTTFGDEMLRFGAAKIFSDGSLGAHTALLAEPYSDQPDTRGIRIHDPEELKKMARNAQEKGFGLAIHAIGDQAVRETIDAIEFALQGESNELHRHRIEHVSLCPPDCLERMAKLKIVAVVQPQFVTSDTWTAARIGARRVPWAYNFKSLQSAGVPVALSSDCPVERVDAFAAVDAAVHRHQWSPNETLPAEEAIRAYCSGSAYAAHMENRLGSLEAGKLADFVILSEDPMRCAGNELKRIRAQRVFVGGREVFFGADQ